MPEESKENKKPAIFKRIFKWLGLGFLTALIILGLVFQAPWKVITLLVIILLACTALPRPYRKWFWLTVAVVVTVLIIWVFLPDDSGDWRPYTFDEELAAIEAKRAIPDSENAATIYNQLLQDYNEDDFEPNLLDPNAYYLTRSGPWSSKDYPEIAQWLRGQESTIVTLMEASKKEQCRFPINADPMKLGQSIDRLASPRRWAYLLIRAANNDIGDDRIDQALVKILAVLQMAKHQCQQPTMLDMLVGIAIEALATRQFNRFIVTGDATEEHLRVIEKALAEIKHDWGSDLPKILEYEKLMNKNFFGIFYEADSKGRVRLSRNPMKTVSAQYKEELPPLTYWHKRVSKIAFIQFWFFMPSTPQKAAEIIDDSFEVLYEMAEPDFNWQKKPEGPRKLSLKLNCYFTIKRLVHIMEPAYRSVHDTYLRTIAQQRASRLIIALRRYKNQNGFWPVNLDDVKSMAPEKIFVDPTNGGDFAYEITEENFRLYSKGKNGIDEDGERDEIAGADDWLIWPPRSRKNQKENTDAE